MRYIIYSYPEDTHAMVVKLALEALGHDVLLWSMISHPDLITHSIAFHLKQTFWKSTAQLGMHTLSEHDVVWYRRVKRPHLDTSLMHPDDYEFVMRENRLFVDAFTLLLSTQAWWINPPLAARRANAKLFQLQLARACGLMIPLTLCSNAPEDIRSFLKQHHPNQVIYKPFCTTRWIENNQVKALYTMFITEQDLPPDEILKLTPGIFQPYIEKHYELRITCFGSHCVAVKIDSPQTGRGRIDWRAIPEAQLMLSPYELPQPLEYKIQTLMRRLGLMFACIDMIVTPAGEYVFLEINEQGQFLWIEEINANIQLLDRFIHFLVNRSFYFNWCARHARIALQDYLIAAQSNAKPSLVKLS